MAILTSVARRNLNTLSVDEKKALIKSIYSATQPSYFQTLFKADDIEIACNQHSQNLRQHISDTLIHKKIISQPVPLEQLHLYLSDEMRAYNFNDGVNKVSTYFYDLGDAFNQIYFQFIHFLREKVVTEPFYFQATPTIRIHCPNALHSDHYPRYHSDISYGHPPEEINIWLPLTDILDGHSFRIISVANSNFILQELEYDFAKFIDGAINDKAFSDYCTTFSKAVTTPYQSLYAFDSRCIHSGEPMQTHTRISLDIRLVPLSQYEKMKIQYQGSGRRRILFEPGHCYFHLHSDQLL